MTTFSPCKVLQLRPLAAFCRLPTVCLSRKAAVEEPQILEKPKKPLNPFFLFLSKKRDELREINVILSNKDLIKKASEEWAELKESEKAVYKEKYSKEANAYKKSYQKFIDMFQNENVSDATVRYAASKLPPKTQKQLLGRPRKPKNVFLMFLQDFRKTLDEGTSIVVASQKGKEAWSKLSSSDRVVYEAKEKLEREEYERKLKDWEAKMLERGFPQLVRDKTAKSKKNIV